MTSSVAIARGWQKRRAAMDGALFDQTRLVGECWEWTGKVQRPSRTSVGGYGVLSRNGRQVFAHRRAYEIAVGPIPAGLELMHSCDNRRCIRPSHLTPGTRAENMADMAVKDRAGRGWLDEATVSAIRLETGSARAVGGRYGVSRSTIQRVRCHTYRPAAVR